MKLHEKGTFLVATIALLFGLGGSSAFLLPSPMDVEIRSTSALLVRKEESVDEQQQQQNSLLEQARRLREEADRMETDLRERRPRSSSSSSMTAPPVVRELADSTWTISYRFSSQPKEEEDDDKTTKEKPVVLPNYGGKVTVRLRADGYSDIVSAGDDVVQISKVWGWDEEYSQDDDQKYLLFSMDARLPASDPLLGGQVERFYFQARVDRSQSAGIQLQEGTVTVKKDVSEQTKGRWGLFRVAGILTQFRYVGDFVARPAVPAASPE